MFYLPVPLGCQCHSHLCGVHPLHCMADLWHGKGSQREPRQTLQSGVSTYRALLGGSLTPRVLSGPDPMDSDGCCIAFWNCGKGPGDLWFAFGATLAFFWRIAQVHSQIALSSCPVGSKKFNSLPSFGPIYTPFSLNWTVFLLEWLFSSMIHTHINLLIKGSAPPLLFPSEQTHCLIIFNINRITIFQIFKFSSFLFNNYFFNSFLSSHSLL